MKSRDIRMISRDDQLISREGGTRSRDALGISREGGTRSRGAHGISREGGTKSRGAHGISRDMTKMHREQTFFNVDFRQLPKIFILKIFFLPDKCAILILNPKLNKGAYYED